MAVFLSGCLPAGKVGGTAALAVEEGEASYYSDAFEGRPTSSGEAYRRAELTAAHRRFPFGTVVRVVDPATGREVEVRINDRGPARAGRIIDLSRAAADRIGILASGIAHVRLEVLAWGP